MLDSLEYMICW